jgi:hypothetical protein
MYFTFYLEGNNITTDGMIAFVHKEEWKDLMQLKLRTLIVTKDLTI